MKREGSVPGIARGWIDLCGLHLEERTCDIRTRRHWLQRQRQSARGNGNLGLFRGREKGKFLEGGEAAAAGEGEREVGSA